MGILAEHAAIGILRENLPVCILAGDSNEVDLATDRIERAGFTVGGTDSPHEALEKVRLGACRAVLADLKMKGMDGLTFLEKALQLNPEICVILAADVYSADSAVEAIKRGAHDYLCKPLDFSRLEKILDELAEDLSQRAGILFLEERLFELQQFHGIVGKSPAMIEAFALIKRISRHYTHALITGPSGAGKELIARTLHDLSPVAHERFAVCDCSALADTAPESQLLDGLFGNAKGGTLFLDEVGETSLLMQAKLFGAIQRMGSTERKKAYVPIIAATSRDLSAEVLIGRFREDLFRCLRRVEIRVPSLDERPEDISVLVHHFLKKHSQANGKRLLGVTRRAEIALLRHDWSGDVRELETVISRAAITARAEQIDLRDLPERLQQPKCDPTPSSQHRWPVPLEEMRRIHIYRVLEMCDGNRVRAARMLGIGRTSLYRFLKRAAKQAVTARSGA
jgi:two-component system, NtrC family, response regulator HydG